MDIGCIAAGHPSSSSGVSDDSFNVDSTSLTAHEKGLTAEVPRLELCTESPLGSSSDPADPIQTRPSTQIKVKQHERKGSSEDGIHYVDDDDGVEFALDSRHLNRVHEELEKLNIATDVINKLELQLDEARMHFRQIHASWLRKLEEASRKYGTAIAKSRPYYAALTEDRRIKTEAQASAVHFERATSFLQVAKQQVKLTQDSLARQGVVEPECLEVLNHHVQRVSEAEKERSHAEEQHRLNLEKTHLSAQLVRQLEKENGRAIKKSKHYFDLRYEFQRIMQSQKGRISMLEKEVKQKKLDYTSSLRNLERISDSIHEERSLTSGKRGSDSVLTPDTERRRGGIANNKSQFHSVQSELDRTKEDACAETSTSSNSISRRSSRVEKLKVSDEGQIGLSASMDSINCSCPADLPELPEGFLPDSMLNDEEHFASSLNASSRDGDGDGGGGGGNGLGSGVILLAQQLIRGSATPSSGGKGKAPIVVKSALNLTHHSRSIDESGARPKRRPTAKRQRDDGHDVRYRTTPAGIVPIDSSSAETVHGEEGDDECHKASGATRNSDIGCNVDAEGDEADQTGGSPFRRTVSDMPTAPMRF